MKLSNAKIKSLKPKDRTYKISDGFGLNLMVTNKGSKLWRMNYRFNGKQKTLSFGAYPIVSLAVAREKMRAAKVILSKGKDPSTVNAKANDTTFRKLAEELIEKNKREGLSETTIKKKQWLLNMGIREFGNLPIKDITTQIVLKPMKERQKQGHIETAHRLRTVFGEVFRFAIANGLTDYDPTYATKGALDKKKPKSRAAITDKKRLPKLMKDIRSYYGSPKTRIGLELVALLASRPGEIRTGRWVDIDLNEGVWAFPAEIMKMREPHITPLSKRAIEILKELHRTTGWGELILPSNSSSKKPMGDSTFNQALVRMGYSKTEITPHGFRSTFSTIANESELWSPDIIEVHCARKPIGAVRAKYNRSKYWEQRKRLAEWWAEQWEETGV